jgi:Uma2 family endonuclease
MSTVTHISLEHFERLVDAGFFEGEFRKRVELVRGEVVEMSPIGSPHSDIVDRVAAWSFKAIGDRPIRVRVQNPLRIPANDSEPEPDVAWVVEGNYSGRHPQPDEVLLLIEVAEHSLAFDRRTKLAIYAEAGIAEYWIVNLPDEQIETYREPQGLQFLKKSIYRGSAFVSPLAIPSASLPPSRLFS